MIDGFLRGEQLSENSEMFSDPIASHRRQRCADRTKSKQ